MSKIMFIDESGDHSLRIIDPEYPVFVLAGVIMETSDVAGVVRRTVTEFKKDQIGSTDVLLRTADITRQRQGFDFLVDAARRLAFYEALNQLMAGLPYEVVACAIRKFDHRAKHGAEAFDPYELGLHVLVERMCFAGGGTIIAESRDPYLDARIKAEWARLRRDGSYFVTGDRIRSDVSRMTLLPKSANVLGLQIADLVANPIGRHVIGKTDRPDWAVIEKKFRTGPEGYAGRGLVILPKE